MHQKEFGAIGPHQDMGENACIAYRPLVGFRARGPEGKRGIDDRKWKVGTEGQGREGEGMGDGKGDGKGPLPLQRLTLYQPSFSLLSPLI